MYIGVLLNVEIMCHTRVGAANPCSMSRMTSCSLDSALSCSSFANSVEPSDPGGATTGLKTRATDLSHFTNCERLGMARWLVGCLPQGSPRLKQRPSPRPRQAGVIGPTRCTDDMFRWRQAQALQQVLMPCRRQGPSRRSYQRV